MHIEDFGPFRQARERDMEQQRARRFARALSQVLSLQPGLPLGVLLDVPGPVTPQEALEAWVRDTLSSCEGASDREILTALARKFEKTMASAGSL